MNDKTMETEEMEVEEEVTTQVEPENISFDEDEIDLAKFLTRLGFGISTTVAVILFLRNRAKGKKDKEPKQKKPKVSFKKKVADIKELRDSWKNVSEETENNEAKADVSEAEKKADNESTEK